MKHVILDERRQVFVAKTEEEAYDFCLNAFIEEAKKNIAAQACFSVALSGGNTPKPLYERLTQSSSALLVNWSFLHVFLTDERCVPSDSPESNYRMLMEYFSCTPLNQAKVYRPMADSQDLDAAACAYEKSAKKAVKKGRFDMVLLGVGDDGHTASLFPNTAALKEQKRLFVPNHVPQKDCWRMTMTFAAIEQARSLYALVLGKSKSQMLKSVLFGSFSPDEFPSQRLGTPACPVCYVIDKKAAFGLGL